MTCILSPKTIDYAVSCLSIPALEYSQYSMCVNIVEFFIHLLRIIPIRSSVTRWDSFLVFVSRGIVTDLLHSLHLRVLPAVQLQVLDFADVCAHAAVNACTSHADEYTKVVRSPIRVWKKTKK